MSNTKKAAIILSGCGVFDGAEITEAVATIFGVYAAGATPIFFAPNIEQVHVINHLNGEVENETRNVLEESARIARGNIQDLKDFNANEVDAAFFVGGFGAAKNLSDFAFKDADATLNKEVENAVLKMFELKKPLGFLCIAPASVGAVALGKFGVTLTIGNAPQTATEIQKLGALHQNCEANNFVKDPNFEVYSTPAYMLAKTPLDIQEGVAKMAYAMLK